MANIVTAQNWRNTLLNPQTVSALQEKCVDGVSGERILRLILGIMSKRSDMMTVTPQSVLSCAADCAVLGLEPSVGQVYFIRYGNELTIQVGYKGLIELAMRSGNISRIEANIVFENDIFELEYGTNQHLRHCPNFMKPGRPILCYCIISFKNGMSNITTMTMEEIEQVRHCSKSGDSGPWKTFRYEMCKKAVLRRALKLCEVSTMDRRFIDAITYNDDADPIIDARRQNRPSQTDTIVQEISKPTIMIKEENISNGN